MLKLRRRDRQAREAPDASLHECPDLQIRNLLDDPALRRAMGLDEPAPAQRPEPRFDRRRLLERAAA